MSIPTVTAAQSTPPPVTQEAVSAESLYSQVQTFFGTNWQSFTENATVKKLTQDITSNYQWVKDQANSKEDNLIKTIVVGSRALKNSFMDLWKEESAYQPYLAYGVACGAGFATAHGISNLKKKGLKDLYAWSEIALGAGSYYFLKSNLNSHKEGALNAFALSLFTSGIYLVQTSTIPAPASTRFQQLKAEWNFRRGI